MTSRRHCFRAVLGGIAVAGVVMLAAGPGGRALAQGDPAPGHATVTDLAGRRVSVPVPVRRVMLGEGRLLHVVAALEPEDPLARVGAWRDDLIEADPGSYRQYLAAFPALAKLPRFGGAENSLVDAESAIALGIDVVLLNIEAMRAVEDARTIEKLGAVGIPVVYVDFRHDPTSNTGPTIRLLGRLFGREARAEQIAAFRDEQIRRVTDVIAARSPARPDVFIERIGGYTDDCCLSFGDGNFGRFVEMAGGNNIARTVIPGTFGQVNPEQVIAADPDHVVVTSAEWEAYVPGGRWIPLGPGADQAEAARKLEWYRSRPAYTGVTANRNRAFHGIWHQFYNSPYDFIAIQQLAKWFHPDLFSALRPEETFRTFHERFLPVAYRPGYWVSLAGPER
ncbi:ABC transporter substrate-binding protein [Arenibaculum pallidiluteum]|uniref:ABC transporter substrate-binding protein n=1 Tax=Arenibaculum pallidiluteum TaxID=2812559 RepID=UPI002E2DDD6F|nr:ABC transporter substrate-binding protein [Arenibaculum pallidiluteum]